MCKASAGRSGVGLSAGEKGLAKCGLQCSWAAPSPQAPELKRPQLVCVVDRRTPTGKKKMVNSTLKKLEKSIPRANDAIAHGS